MPSMVRASAGTATASSCSGKCRGMPTCVAAFRPFSHSQTAAPATPKRSAWVMVPRATDPERSQAVVDDLGLEAQSESAMKAAGAARLRAAEKFMVVGAGDATCNGCGYAYKPENGDSEFPIPRGTKFENLPLDYTCPICGANKDKFQTRLKVVAGFAENQRYGLGTNSMTGDQKLLLIYGSLAVFFALFLAGYALD